MEGTNKAHENGEAMGFVGVRLTDLLGHGYCFLVLHFIFKNAALDEMLKAQPSLREAYLGL